ncbi:extracellular solute-binding protein [Solirhodobacter olei]|uniref:extracellular solute-binding protein n=1 Tax=Solirhodobacter olei TaxID=2493082 RepID=UPI000FD8D58B|nr:extracellular solute-binding protein [Solirhodobacter olei]
MMNKLRMGALIALAVVTAGPPAWAQNLRVFDWSGYEDPVFYPNYMKDHKQKPDFSFFADEDEAFQKLTAGFKADVAHPCSQSVVKWREAGLLEPLDPKKLKWWNDVLPGLKGIKNLMTGPDGKAWLIPFEWGNTALVYRTDKLKPSDVASLQAFADPKYKGMVSIGDNVDDAYALASLAIGVKDWATMTDAQFKAASDFLRKVNKNVRFYWTDGAQLNQAMASGEVELAWAWNETPAQLQAQKVPVAMNRDTKEGLSTWVCGYVRLKGGTAPDSEVYDYLNAVTAPDVSNYLVTQWGYGHSNKLGMAKVDPKVLKADGFDNVEKYTAKTLFQSPVPIALKQKMIAEFQKIKAGF